MGTAAPTTAAPTTAAPTTAAPTTAVPTTAAPTTPVPTTAAPTAAPTAASTENPGTPPTATGATSMPLGGCPPCKSITTGDVKLHGTYILYQGFNEPLPSACMDACVYKKDDLFYCFKES